MQIRCAKCMKLISDEIKVCPFCGHVNDQPAEESLFLRPGTLIRERYVIGEVLGYGGFGATYVAWDETLDRKVAIKEYFPSAFSTRKPSQTALSVFSGDKGEFFRIGLKKYLNEARTIAKLENIPHIVGVREYFEENNTAYIVMEFVEGITMKEHLKTNGTLSAKDAVSLFLPLIKSMSQVHEGHVIHRDISPDNIMINKKGIKLIDFGAAREVYDDDEKSLSIVLKHGYAPEEQYHKRGKQGPWTDVYAMCATLYKCITGKTPPQVFDRLSGEELEPISQMGISIAPYVERAIFKGLNIEIKDRFQSMDELYDALTTVETNENVVKPERKVTVAPVQRFENDPHIDAPSFTPKEVTPDIPVTTISEAVIPEPKTKKNGSKPVIIIVAIAAVLIVAAVITGIAIFGRSGRTPDSPSEAPETEQTAAVVGTDAPSTEESSTEDTTSDTSTEESSTSESTSSTTKKNAVDSGEGENSWTLLPESDFNPFVEGVKIWILGDYEDISSDAKITCEVYTHSCSYDEDSHINHGELYKAKYTFYLYDDICKYDGECICSANFMDCDAFPLGGYETGADIKYVYKEDYVEVSLSLPEGLPITCECESIAPIQYVKITVDENTFITYDGQGNAKWSDSLNNR